MSKSTDCGRVELVTIVDLPTMRVVTEVPDSVCRCLDRLTSQQREAIVMVIGVANDS